MKNALKKIGGFCINCSVNGVLCVILFLTLVSQSWPVSILSDFGLVLSIASPVVGVLLALAGIVLAALLIKWPLVWLSNLADWAGAFNVADGLDDLEQFVGDHHDTVINVLLMILFPIGTGAALSFAAKVWPQSIVLTSTIGALVAGLVITIWIGALTLNASLYNKYFGPPKAAPEPIS
jgi:hypothetical protein